MAFHPRDWKSRAAERLHRMGLSESAKALLRHGGKRQPPPVDERLPNEWRAEGERRAREHAEAPPATLLSRLTRWLRH